MDLIRVVGIDPGLVHTGIVEFGFATDSRTVLVRPVAVKGDSVITVRNVVSAGVDKVFIEEYRPRAHLNADARMGALVRAIHHAFPKSKIISNTGVKQVITKPLMEALKVWTFTTKTHHQDLRSAAYIGLYGLVKDPDLNPALAAFTRDLLDGDPWKVAVL